MIALKIKALKKIALKNIKRKDGCFRKILCLLLITSISFNFCCELSLSDRLKNSSLNNDGNKKVNIVGFWHIGKNYQPLVNGGTRDEFVIKQSKEILSSFLFSGKDKIPNAYDVRLNYVTTVQLSDETKKMLRDTKLIHEHPPTVLKMKPDTEYFESPTLAEVHSFCQAPENKEKIVFYMHSKTIDHERKELTDYLLGKNCATCLLNKEKIACGTNYRGSQAISFFNWSHFSGNFWMARCSHIARLNFPYFPELLEESIANTTTATKVSVRPPYGRYFLEYWMMNDSGERPKHRSGVLGIPGLLRTDQICSNHFEYVSKFNIDNFRWLFRS